MIYEIKNNNSKKLYDFCVLKGYKNSFDDFNEELFNEDENYKTLVLEENNKIVAFVQYSRNKDNKGVIKSFYYDEGYEKNAKELLLKVSSYYYMFHIATVDCIYDGIGNKFNKSFDFKSKLKFC